MANPTLLSSKPLSLSDVKEAVGRIEERNPELGLLTQKTKEYCDAFCTLTVKQKDEITEALRSLEITRLRDEHLFKLVDFMPCTEEELRIVMQSYPITLSKTDKNSIITKIKEFKA